MLINPKKSAAINICKGILVPENLITSDGTEIHSITSEEKIRYLGINFSNKIIFDEKEFLTSLEKDFRKLITTPMLRGDQKLNILDQYVYPKLVFPMQTTPVDLLTSTFLEKVDMVMR